MKLEISLVGYGLTPFGEWWDKSLQDLMREAIDATLQTTKIPVEDVDIVIVANMIGEVTSDQAHLGAMAAGMLPHNPAAMRVESACGSGAFALHTACAFLESGRAQTVLVVGAEKMTDVSVDTVSDALMGAADAEIDAPSGLTFPGIFGLIANRYMYEYGLTRDELSVVSAVHHKHAVKNQFAQFRQEITPEAVSTSAAVSDPLRLLDCSPITDGAAACILSTKHRSGQRIAASQIATDSLSITERPTITSFSATKKAMAKALHEAQIERSAIKSLEVHDCFSIAGVINVEDLGFARPGEGAKLYQELYAGAAPVMVNPSGGLKACGHPIAATGIKQLIDSSKYLKQTRGRYALTHNFGGAGTSCGIHILENTI